MSSSLASALKGRNLRSKLVDNQIVVGTFAQIPCAESVEILAAAGFDYIIIDLEHGPYWYEAVPPLVRAANVGGIGSLCRIPMANAELMAKALDVGADGIIAPRVETRAEAQLLVDECRFPPRGRRGVCSAVRAAGFLAGADFSEESNNQTLMIATIESAKGVENLAEILSVEGLDLVLFGPVDLAYSLGHQGQWDHPEVQDALTRMVRVVRAANVRAAMHVKSISAAGRWVQYGVQMVNYGIDSQIMLVHFREIVKDLRLQTAEMR